MTHALPHAAAPAPFAEELSTRFREAMASYPSGVTVVTTTDDQGAWRGFTATSFCSLSVDPPLVLVCLARTAQCHTAFAKADSWVVQVVPHRRADLATRFATRGVDKFGGGDFTVTAAGHPVFEEAAAVMECESYVRYDVADHTILVGRVRDVRVREVAPAVYFRRGFHALPD
ncbi:flavin reductase ActVB [Streptomyces sp. V3I8]|jgi:flavin reductase ActVB|uniref:flavin reductase family protein n=1 Tax=Streptomyces sp. V3I8 TaxID=3042279 RepID=UPI002789D93F|nr:flavin reductase family protein [Streptomyces sp. V3I8]MDQ1041737.1 flavin reductase ActVB [Streptomyces sp. V3I8]